MRYRIDSPISWIDHAINTLEDDASISDIEFRITGEAIEWQHNQSGTWTPLLTLEQVQNWASDEELTLEQVQALIEDAIANAAPRREPTEAMEEVIRDEVDSWITGHAAEFKGDPGQDGTDGTDGADASPEQIAAAVTTYLEANPPADGEDGQDGQDGEDGQDADMSRVIALETALVGVTGAAATLASRTTALESAVAGVTGYGARITSLETVSVALTGADAAHTSRLTVLEAQTTAVTGAAAALGARVTVLESQTVSITGAATALAARTTTLETGQQTITGAAATLTSRVSVLETRTNTITGDAAALASRTTSLETRVNAITGADAVRDTRITTLETRSVAVTGVNATQDTRLAWLESMMVAVTGYGARLTAEEARTFRAASIDVPVLLLGATADRVITWRDGQGAATPMPNANYRLEYEPNPVLTLGTQVRFAEVADTKTANGVTVRITGVLAIAVASWCNVNAFSN